MTDKLDLDHLRQWIGKTAEASDVVTKYLVMGLRATLFQEIGEPKTGDAAPWTTHWCLAQPVFPMSQLGPDGHPTRGGFLPPVPLPRRPCSWPPVPPPVPWRPWSRCWRARPARP